jgi:Cutinase/Protein of unknown function (DUF2690)/LGFP repeat
MGIRKIVASAATGAFVAAGLITATATAAPPASAAPVLASTASASTATAATACVPTMLIGVHGTGEEYGTIGNELSYLYQQVEPHTGLPEQGLNGWHDDSDLLIELAASVANPLLLPGTVARLQAAINTGAADLYNQVNSEARQCPDEHFVIAGYSQGATVVGQFARSHPELAGRVSGIILWGDPEFNGDDPLTRGAITNGAFTATGGWLGVLSTYYRQRLTFPSAWSGRLRSYCSLLDPVCNWNPSNAALGVRTLFRFHGDERYQPILGDSATLIQGQGPGRGAGWAPSVWNAGLQAFYTKWQGLSGASGRLGLPTTDAVDKPGGGVVQAFSGTACGASRGSALTWSPSSGATREIQGCIYQAYMDRWGGPGGKYGYPASDEQATPGGQGRMNYMTGAGCAGTGGSALIYNPAAGTFPVGGCIFQRYRLIHMDRSGLGLPVSAEIAVPGGVQQNFSHGNIRDLGGKITVTIAGTVLDNTDPYQTGCAGTAAPERTVATAKDGPTVIDLKYSNVCGTNWAVVTPNLSAGHLITMQIWVQRLEGNGAVTTGRAFQFIPNGSVTAWSDQLYAPTARARACENYLNNLTRTWSTPVCTRWV